MTVIELYNYCKDELKAAGKDDFENEANLIVQNVLDIDKTMFLLNKDNFVDSTAISEVQSIIKKRKDSVPLQYIFGEWEFYGENYKVGEGVLVPRPETEELCSLVIEKLQKMKSPTVFDLCAGSGCIGITLKKQVKNADVYLVEYCDKAISYLNENRMKLGVARSVPAIKGNVLDGYDKFGFLPRPDVIVSNPPYVKSAELESLQPEVKNEPETALDGGEDGLDFYRALAEKWLPFINDGGFIAVECGEEQAEAIASMFSKFSEEISIIKDFNGFDRFVIAGKGQK